MVWYWVSGVGVGWHWIQGFGAGLILVLRLVPDVDITLVFLSKLCLRWGHLKSFYVHVPSLWE